METGALEEVARLYAAGLKSTALERLQAMSREDAWTLGEAFGELYSMAAGAVEDME